MAIFYFLHHVLPNTDTFKEGKRNSATFLFGSFLYAVVYVVIKNCQLKYGKYVDSLLSALFVILIADICTMAYIYKSYYGRNILYEFLLSYIICLYIICVSITHIGCVY